MRGQTGVGRILSGGLLLLACSGEPTCPVGAANCPCDETDACYGGLTCRAGVCLEITDAGRDGGGTDAGGTDAGGTDAGDGCVVDEDCRGVIPSPHPFCSVDGAGAPVWHHDARPICDSNGTCRFVETTETCTETLVDACEEGTLTTYTAGCVPETGCVSVPTATPCDDLPTACTASNTLITYEPTCASATECGEPEVEATPCVTPPIGCSGDFALTFRAMCDATTERCEPIEETRTDCGASSTCVCSTGCSGGIGDCGILLETWSCSPDIGCEALSGGGFECTGGCDCSAFPTSFTCL